METVGHFAKSNEKKGGRKDMAKQSYEWGKKKESDKIWWLVNPDSIGEYVFSFDKKKRFYMYRDYPYKLTREQKEIFDRENPFWADFFQDRTEEWEKMHKE